MATVEQLIRDARAGDREAIDRLLERYRPFVQLVVRCRGVAGLQRRMDSSDVVQETLLHAAEGFAGFAGTVEPEWRAWLGKVAHREMTRQVRRHVHADRRAVAREQPLAEAPTTGSLKLDDWLAASITSPSLAAVRQEQAVWLAEQLGRLSDDDREVLILRHIEGLGFPEIARRMDRTAGAVRVLWVRALRRLRDLLAESDQWKR